MQPLAEIAKQMKRQSSDSQAEHADYRRKLIPKEIELGSLDDGHRNRLHSLASFPTSWDGMLTVTRGNPSWLNKKSENKSESTYSAFKLFSGFCPSCHNFTNSPLRKALRSIFRVNQRRSTFTSPRLFCSTTCFNFWKSIKDLQQFSFKSSRNLQGLHLCCIA